MSIGSLYGSTSLFLARAVLIGRSTTQYSPGCLQVQTHSAAWISCLDVFSSAEDRRHDRLLQIVMDHSTFCFFALAGRVGAALRLLQDRIDVATAAAPSREQSSLKR